jgi:hypothetical protein
MFFPAAAASPNRYYLPAFFTIFTEMMWIWLLIDERRRF